MITVEDKPAIRITAVWVRQSGSGKSDLYDCEGDKLWVPKSVSRYNSETNDLDIQEWFYNQLEKEGLF